MKLALLLVQVCLCTSVCSAQKIQQLFSEKRQADPVKENADVPGDWLANATAQLNKQNYYFKNTRKKYAFLKDVSMGFLS